MRKGLLLLLMLWLPLSVGAVDLSLERMLSPGPLSQAHVKQENDCASCHGDDRHRGENQLCLSCHETVGKDLTTKSGFHGKKSGVAASECRLCHSEHQGLQADIVQLSPHGFDHRMTDFPLQGLHRQVPCAQCHDSAKKMRDAPHACVQCHRADDVHKGSQGEQCQDCHGTDGWRKTQFDHGKTAFPLRGKHADVTCSQCHRSNDYQQADTTCISCHKIDDVHLSSMGNQCDSCHATDGWKQARFDHRKDTRFPLLGAHNTLQCATCHRPHSVATDLPQTCIGCHRHDDPHFGKNGEQCEQCHNNNSWGKSRFDHSQTDFPLAGKHRELRCDQCHQSNVHAPIKDQSCNGCHNTDDVHKKSLGSQCLQCHDSRSWNENIRFDHDLTHFPLLGRHATVACESCHSNFQYVGIGANCSACHGGDDIHHGNLGTQCESCHHPVDWKSWRFDHDKQTEFALTGSHRGLACDACHDSTPEKIKAAAGQCGRCHQNDDVHRGAYGMQCDTCHGTTDFSTLQMR